jgi:hypothetical protein
MERILKRRFGVCYAFDGRAQNGHYVRFKLKMEALKKTDVVQSYECQFWQNYSAYWLGKNMALDPAFVVWHLEVECIEQHHLFEVHSGRKPPNEIEVP